MLDLSKVRKALSQYIVVSNSQYDPHLVGKYPTFAAADARVVCPACSRKARKKHAYGEHCLKKAKAPTPDGCPACRGRHVAHTYDEKCPKGPKDKKTTSKKTSEPAVTTPVVLPSTEGNARNKTTYFD